MGALDENHRKELYEEASKLLGVADNAEIRARISVIIQCYAESETASDEAPGFSEARGIYEDIDKTAGKFLEAVERALSWPDVFLLGSATDTREYDPERREQDRAARAALESEARDVADRVRRLRGTISERRAIRKNPKDTSEPGWPEEARDTNVRGMANAEGLPKYELVGLCYEVFDELRPGEATGAEGGPFRLFCNAVYELATGDDPDDDESHAGLLKIIANVIRIRRNRRADNG